MTPRRFSVRVLGVLAIAGIWLLLAPPALGGRTSYVVTSGISMEPRFHTGDLALVRAQTSYAIGEIVAYRSPTLGEVILHRLHSGDAVHGFRTKGDNNSWIDPDTVHPDEILGALWLQVPRVGAFAHAGTMVPLAVVLAAGSLAAPARSRLARRGRHSRRRDGPVRGRAQRSVASVLLVTATVLGVAGAGLVVLAMLANAPAPDPAPFVTHTLALTYSAAADPAVYQGGSLVTGDPVFLKLTPSIDVRLDDRVSGASAAVARPLELRAQLVGASGWQYVVPLQGQASVSGTTSTLRVHLDVRALQAVVAQAAARTGFDASNFQLQLLPTLVTPSQGGSVTFKPLAFRVGGGQLLLANAPAQRGAGVTQNATEPAPAESARPTPAKRVHLGGLSVPAAPLTIAGLAALVVAGLLVGAGALQMRRDPLARLTQPLITVAARDLGARTVMTASVDELFELAKRYNRPVLEMVVAGQPTYAVEEGGTWYGCYVGRRPDGTEEPWDEEAYRAALDDDVPPPPPPRGSPEDSLDPV